MQHQNETTFVNCTKLAFANKTKNVHISSLFFFFFFFNLFQIGVTCSVAGCELQKYVETRFERCCTSHSTADRNWGKLFTYNGLSVCRNSGF